MNTPKYAPQYSGNDLSCTNCHLNGGQKEKALPLVGVAETFPGYNKRGGRLFSLEGRKAPAETWPSPRSEEVLALSAYITWLSEGLPVGQKATSPSRSWTPSAARSCTGRSAPPATGLTGRASSSART